MSASAAPPVKSDSLDIKITLRSAEVRLPLLSNVIEFFDEFNSLYEVSRWIADEDYDQFRRRESNILREDIDESTLKSLMSLNVEDKLRVERLSLNSPIELVTYVAAVPAAITAIWGIVQILDKIVNLKKLKLEIQKLESELAKSKIAQNAKKIDDDESNFLNRFDSAGLIERLIFGKYHRRFVNVAIRIQEVEIEVVERTTEK